VNTQEKRDKRELWGMDVVSAVRWRCRWTDEDKEGRRSRSEGGAVVEMVTAALPPDVSVTWRCCS
jgi:hypothetical protein